MISRRFVFITLAIFILSLTSCVRDIENDSILTISGFIDPISNNEVESSNFYIVGTISYIPVTNSGEKLERSKKYFLSDYNTKLNLSPDFHYEVDIPVRDYRRNVKSLTAIEIENLQLLRVSGNIKTYFPLFFDNEGVQLGQESGTYQVRALDITL